VLLVEEDNDAIAHALVDVLGANGHQLTWCRVGADALTAHRDADIVLLDLGLPDIDGLELLRRVSTVPVRVLTARGDERSVVRGLRGGADDYVQPHRDRRHPAASRCGHRVPSIARPTAVTMDGPIRMRRTRTGGTVSRPSRPGGENTARYFLPGRKEAEPRRGFVR
jgi:CheY-like chemotaxis protein